MAEIMRDEINADLLAPIRHIILETTMANSMLEVLTRQRFIFIDHQPQMAFGVQSIARQTLKHNTVALAKAEKVFKISSFRMWSS